jgi:DNA-directed RNA polymerase specialized sigma subunit
MKTYTVEAVRDGKWWILRTVEAPGAVSQVRKLSQAEEYIREAFSYTTGEPDDTFTVQVVPQFPDRVAAEIAGAKSALADLDRRQRAAAVLSRAAARDLLAEGLTGAEVAKVLRVSPQRVSQLVRDSRELSDDEVSELIQQYT